MDIQIILFFTILKNVIDIFTFPTMIAVGILGLENLYFIPVHTCSAEICTWSGAKSQQGVFR